LNHHVLLAPVEFENNFAENNCRELQKDVKYKNSGGIKSSAVSYRDREYACVERLTL
jgi:hypothetical protein